LSSDSDPKTFLPSKRLKKKTFLILH